MFLPYCWDVSCVSVCELGLSGTSGLEIPILMAATLNFLRAEERSIR